MLNWILYSSLEEIKIWSSPIIQRLILPFLGDWKIKARFELCISPTSEIAGVVGCVDNHSYPDEPLSRTPTDGMNTPSETQGRKKRTLHWQRWLDGNTNVGLKQWSWFKTPTLHINFLGMSGSQYAPSTLWHRSHPLFKRCLWFHFLLFSVALCELSNV